MISQLRDKKQISNRNKIKKNIALFVFLCLTAAVGTLSFVSSSVYSLGNIFWRTRNKFFERVFNISYVIHTKKSLIKENEILKARNATLEERFLSYENLTKENQDLKDLYGKKNPNNNFILGNILVKPNRSPYDTLIIDIGRVNGVKEGDKVYAESLLSIGRVSSVYENTSLVILYSNPSESTYATLENSNTNVDLIGRGGGNFELSVPSNLQVSIGEKVLLPGDNLDIIAIVDENISKANDAMKKIILHAPINIQNLKWVQVKKS